MAVILDLLDTSIKLLYEDKAIHSNGFVFNTENEFIFGETAEKNYRTQPREVNNKIMPRSDLILAIIRQESEFDRKANSYVGARGMMQLMKYTAKIVAKQAKLPYSISGLTRDPEYNIKLGSYYFNSLLEDYNGVYPFALAAYNAGPNRLKT